MPMGDFPFPAMVDCNAPNAPNAPKEKIYNHLRNVCSLDRGSPQKLGYGELIGEIDPLMSGTAATSCHVL